MVGRKFRINSVCRGGLFESGGGGAVHSVRTETLNPRVVWAGRDFRDYPFHPCHGQGILGSTLEQTRTAQECFPAQEPKLVYLNTNNARMSPGSPMELAGGVKNWLATTDLYFGNYAQPSPCHLSMCMWNVWFVSDSLSPVNFWGLTDEQVPALGEIRREIHYTEITGNCECIW